MTAIFYPDCETASPSGRFILEARSPHNGTLPPRKRKHKVENDFAFIYRQNQSGFRYRLLEHASGGSEPRVVWERWQKGLEDSPHELRVSDDGWSILRTHGFNPEVIAVSPSGHDAIRVRVVGEHGAPGSPKDGSARKHEQEARYEWRAQRLGLSTAGAFWADNSWPYFFRGDDTACFAWRTYWGQRLVLDLTHATLVPEDSPERASLTQAMDDEEKRGVHALLLELSEQRDEVLKFLAQRNSEEVTPQPLLDKLKRAVAAFHLAGVHRLRECIPFLRRWEAIDYPRYRRGSTAFGMGSPWWLEAQAFRPILHHALRLLGEEPQGYAAYHFRRDTERLPIPERLTDRRQRAADLNPSMSAEQVLQCVGSPDHVRQRAHPTGKGLYRSTEEWEYDFRAADAWVTLRLTWEEHRKTGRITSIEEVPADWLQTDERVLEILGH